MICGEHDKSRFYFPPPFPRLMRGWWSEDPMARMRAADASEKITREKPDLLRPYKKELLALMAKAE